MKFQQLPSCFQVQGSQWRFREGSMFKPEVRNSRWRRQTGSTCISAAKDSNEIPTANRMFPGSGNSMAISGRLYLGTGSQKFKMVAAKPEVPVSQHLYKTA
jgi:hypothetical protein